MQYMYSFFVFLRESDFFNDWFVLDIGQASSLRVFFFCFQKRQIIIIMIKILHDY
jgi:hypothetical protein